MILTRTFKLALAAAILVGGLMTGCSDDGEAGGSGLVAEVIDSVALAVAENIAASREVVTVADTDFAVEVEAELSRLPIINDLLVDGSVVHAVYDGGLLSYDLTSGDFSLVETDENLRSIVKHAGEIFVGGCGLYRLFEGHLVSESGHYDGIINDLCSYGPSLMVGTSSGLYARNVLGLISVLDEMDISAMAADRDGLWVGTSGDGLYRWDGLIFTKRFLIRDTSLFDYVTSIAFNHDHLYLGTFDGLFVNDGGRWNQLTEETGLPSVNIRSLDASGWVVYIGTSQGLVRYFDGDITPINRLDKMDITSVAVAGQKIIVGTETDGLVIKSGPQIKSIRQPWQPAAPDLASMVTRAH